MKISNLPTQNRNSTLQEQSLIILHKYWGYDKFRGIQSEIIQSICNGKDTLGLMPTGGGKSITFQVSSLMMEGVCIVITPLIALMKDQVAHLRNRGIKATAIYSGMSRSDILRSLENCILGNYKFLYISPERISSELFQTKLAHMTVNLITVDEAHCISQWGYDFRPSYLQINDIRRLKPEAPVLALTASATTTVVKDIQHQLNFKEENVFRMSFERPNLTYSVMETNNKDTTLLSILLNTTGSAIVYTRNREQTAEIAKFLTQNDIPALHYHAGLENTDKDMRQQLWQDDLVRVMVATNAFGMGIDKPDVRTVIHTGVPDSIESYYQEAGRAGRDGKPAQAILLKSRYDIANLKRHIDSVFPPKDYIRDIYEKICYYYEVAVGDGYGIYKEFDVMQFCKLHKLFSLPVLSAFRILENAGYIQYTEPEDCVSCIKVVVTREELYRIHHLSTECDAVLQSLLRTYNGLFADLMPIEELLLAQRTKLTPEAVYKSLRTLHMLGIIYYIPFKHIAHIRFLQRRVETDELIFTPEVYEHRRAELVQRVNAMINYLNSVNICHSRMLSEYFGDNGARDCGHCDVCIRNGYSNNHSDSNETESAAQAIITLLSDGASHPFTELKGLPFSMNALKQATETLLNQNEITCLDGQFTLN